MNGTSSNYEGSDASSDINGTATEIDFITSILKVLNEYIQNKTLNVMEARFDHLRAEIDKLVEEINSSAYIDLEQPISISCLDDETAVLIMDEIGSYGLESLGNEGISVKVRLTD
jgi:hypothetical protein